MVDAPLSPEEIASAFKEPIVPIRVTRGYRIRLLGVLCGLVLLQFLYILLIAVIVAATLRYTFVVLASKLDLNLITIAFYVGPPAAGIIAVLFLLKPLVIRGPRPPQALLIRREDQPDLFSFVDALCRVLDSPRPSRVKVDLQVNASAGVRGWLGFLIGDLELTIGLPLVTGLTAAQFGGVLAHEFGHFTQRTGLRSYFLIQSIQGWFARVVYQRDHWDDWLARQRKHRDWRITGIAHVAQGVVTASRKYLGLLMRAGSWLSSGFSRQMEFDADRYEAAIVGTDVFEQTSRLLPLLNFGAGLAWEDARNAWSTRRLPNDFAALVQTRASLLPDEAQGQILEQVFKQTTGRWDSHPSTTDRIASVRRDGSKGVLRIDGPASRLFRDLPSLSRRATHYHYENLLGIPGDSMHVVSAEESVAESIAAQAFDSATRALFSAPPEFCSRWFRLPSTEPAAPIHGSSTSSHGSVVFDAAAYDYAARMNLNHFAALAIAQCGIKIQAASFQLDVTELAAIRAEEALSSRNLSNMAEEFRLAAQSIGERIAAVVARFESDDLTINLDAHWRGPIPDFKPGYLTYLALSRCQDELMEVRRHVFAMQIVKANARLFPTAVCANLLENLGRQARVQIDRVVERSGSVPSVVVFDPDHPATVGSQLAALADPSHEDMETFLARADVLAARSLGQLAWFTISASRCE